jgi:hypothetical protein
VREKRERERESVYRQLFFLDFTKQNTTQHNTTKEKENER